MKILPSIAFFATALLFGCSKAEIYDIPSPEPEAVVQTVCSEGVLKVKFDAQTVLRIESLGEDQFMDELSGLGVYSMERLFPDAGEMEARQRRAGLHQWYLLYYKKEVIEATKAVTGVSELFGESCVEMPRKIKPLSISFNDPYYGYQWALNNTGQSSGFLKGLDINVVPVWKYSGGSPDVIVNVVDTGIDVDHPDLNGSIIPGGADGSRNFVDDSFVITDCYHGTHVAGIIAAKNNNGKGVCGIAGGLDGKGGVRILNSQIFKQTWDGSYVAATEEKTARAIVWGANHGALISQNSWGYNYDSEEEALADRNPQSIIDAIDYFVSNAGCDADGRQVGLMKGGLVVFAAGNDGWRIGHPADYEAVLAVGAVGPSGKGTSYSNYGPWVDICAPGGDFEAFNVDESMVLSTGSSGQYMYGEGTSMACPHVSGVAALLISLYGKNGFTNETLRNMLVSGANYNYGPSEGIGPMLDADGARQMYVEEKPPVINTSYAGDYVVKAHEVLSIDYTVTSSSDKLTISVDSGEGAIANIGERSFSLVINDGSGNKTGKYKAKFKVVSASGLTAEKEIEYEILKNNPPYVTKYYPDQTPRLNGTILTIDCAELFVDPDGGSLKFDAGSEGDGAVSVRCSGSKVVIKVLSNGVDNITISATDPCGASASQSFRTGCYDDTQNGPAAFPNPVSDILKVCVGGTADIEVKLYSSTGVKLHEASGVCSILDPLKIDMTTFAPGRYILSVKADENEYKKTVVKK